MTSFDVESVDAFITAIGWVLGLSLIFVASSVVGFTFWWAQALDEPGLLTLIGRTMLAFFGILLITAGGASCAIGTESALGYPFGASSGGTVLFAYLLGLRLATLELAASHGLLRQLADRTESTLHTAFAMATLATGSLVWGFTALLSFICFVVAMNMAFGV